MIFTNILISCPGWHFNIANRLSPERENAKIDKIILLSMFCFGNLLFSQCFLNLFLPSLCKIQGKIDLLRDTLNVKFCMSKEYWVCCWYQFRWILLFLYVSIQYGCVINLTSNVGHFKKMFAIFQLDKVVF